MIQAASAAGRLLADPFLKNSDPHNIYVSIQIGTDGILAAMLDMKSGTYLGLQEFSTNNDGMGSKMTTGLQDFISSGILPLSNVGKVTAGIITEDATLIPEALFEEEKSRECLEFVIGNRGNHSFENDRLVNSGARLLYAIPLSLKKDILNLLPQAGIRHASTSLLEGLALKYRESVGDKIALNILKSQFGIAFFRDGKFIYFNSFNHSSDEDIVYYTLFAFQQLGLEANNVETELYGEVDRASSTYSLLVKYIKSLILGVRPASLSYSPVLGSLPQNRYFSLFHQYLCE